eukprot:647824-Hanusia_phi.AAC.3
MTMRIMSRQEKRASADDVKQGVLYKCSGDVSENSCSFAPSLSNCVRIVHARKACGGELEIAQSRLDFAQHVRKFLLPSPSQTISLCHGRRHSTGSPAGRECSGQGGGHETIRLLSASGGTRRDDVSR